MRSQVLKRVKTASAPPVSHATNTAAHARWRARGQTACSLLESPQDETTPDRRNSPRYLLLDWRIGSSTRIRARRNQSAATPAHQSRPVATLLPRHGQKCGRITFESLARQRPAGQYARSNVRSAWERTLRRQTGERREVEHPAETARSYRRIGAWPAGLWSSRKSCASAPAPDSRPVPRKPAASVARPAPKGFQVTLHQYWRDMPARRLSQVRSASWFSLLRESVPRSTAGLRHTARRWPGCWQKLHAPLRSTCLWSRLWKMINQGRLER